MASVLEPSATTALLAAIVGGIIGPIALAEYTKWRRDRSWANPRKELLLQMLSEPYPRTRSLKNLTRVTGTKEEECRTLLIELKARGVRMTGGVEGWALIKRFPLDEKTDLKDTNK